MELYIKSCGIVSAAGDNSGEQFLSAIPEYQTDRLLCDKLDYTAYIPPMQLRRMSKVVRMGVAASKICLQKAGIDRPDAILIGTGMGCLYDTEQFLSKMVTQDEQMLTPTSFIQSTHNTVGGQVALLTGCHGHNLTFVQRGHSFEHAILDAQLYLDDHPSENILVGGLDELIDTSFEILKSSGVYSSRTMDTAAALAGAHSGSLAGEGAGFALLGAKSTPGSLCIKDLSLFVTNDTGLALQKVSEFAYRHQLSQANINLAMVGKSGDAKYRPFYQGLEHGVFKSNPVAAFKHLSGEYATASACALALLSHIATTGIFPPAIFAGQPPSSLANIVLVNNYMDHYSCWYLTMA